MFENKEQNFSDLKYKVVKGVLFNICYGQKDLIEHKKVSTY